MKIEHNAFDINEKVDLTKGGLAELLSYAYSVSNKHRSFAYIIDSFLDIRKFKQDILTK